MAYHPRPFIIFLALLLSLLICGRVESFSTPISSRSSWDRAMLGIKRGCCSAVRPGREGKNLWRRTRILFSFAMSGFEEESEDSEYEEEGEVLPLLEYKGPLSARAKMDSGVTIGNIGLEVMVGPSTKEGFGRGLFIALSEGVDRTVLPQGTPICGYSKEGSWDKDSSGDKCVAYAFDNAEAAVFFEQTLMPLIDAAGQSEAELQRCVTGHEIFFDEETSRVCIAPDGDYKGPRYFVPDASKPVSVGNMGMFANDLAFSPGCTEQDYRMRSKECSILQLAWRMERGEGNVLRPTWPVVILSRDVAFNNDFLSPMEVGVHYGWKYWDEVMRKKLL